MRHNSAVQYVLIQFYVNNIYNVCSIFHSYFLYLRYELSAIKSGVGERF